MIISGIDITNLTEKMKETNWKESFYDPLHDFIEAETMDDKVAFAKLEQLIHDMQTVHASGPEGKVLIESMANYYWKDQPMEDQIETLFPGIDLKRMSMSHVISDEVLDQVHMGFFKNENWIAYNSQSYFLEKGDVYSFKEETEARDFARHNISDYDNYKVIYAESIIDLFKQIPYGENFGRQFIDPDANGLYNKDGNAFTDALIDHIEQQQIIKYKNVSIMNEKNFEYLKDNIKYMGFGEKQNDALEQNLKEGKDSFQLKFTAEVNKKPFEAILNFRKSDNSDMYFFNNYQASLERNNGEKLDQTFYLTKGKGVTAKEAYNLLEGRAVFKELSNKAGDPYKAWIQLDFEKKDKNNNHEVKQYHENYGYDLKSAVAKFPVLELDGGEKEKALLQSLQKGNIQSVSMQTNGEAQKMFVEANPQFKTITVYNEKFQRLGQEQRLEILEKQGTKELKEDKQLDVKQDNKKSSKQSVANDPEGPKKKTSRRKGMSI